MYIRLIPFKSSLKNPSEVPALKVYNPSLNLFHTKFTTQEDLDKN